MVCFLHPVEFVVSFFGEWIYQLVYSVGCNVSSSGCYNKKIRIAKLLQKKQPVQYSKANTQIVNEWQKEGF